MPDIVDYELDEAVLLDSPLRIKAAADPVRTHILDLVLERAMSVSELARIVGKSKGTVAHHVDVLLKAGLLKVVRVRQVRAMQERFYGRVARTIVYEEHEGDDLPFFAEARAEADTNLMGKDDKVPAGFTLRHARIPSARAAEWVQRFQDLALEFSRQPREGDTEYAVIVGLYPTTRRVVPRKNTKKVAT